MRSNVRFLLVVSCILLSGRAANGLRHGNIPTYERDRYTPEETIYKSPTRWASSGDTTLDLRGGASTDVSRFLHAIDFFGTAVFAFSGAIAAGKKGMDLIGMICIASVTSVGGGTYRDVLLGSTPVFWMRQPIYLTTCVAVAVATNLVWPTMEKEFGWSDSSKVVCVSDTLGLAAFAVLGTEKVAATTDLNPIVWIVSGLMTATFGGIARDVICQEPPRSMYPHRTMYAVHPLLGSAVYAALVGKLGTQSDTAAIISFLLVCTTRIMSFNNRMRLPHWRQKANQPIP